jgi:hypothetical protein
MELQHTVLVLLPTPYSRPYHSIGLQVESPKGGRGSRCIMSSISNVSFSLAVILHSASMREMFVFMLGVLDGITDCVAKYGPRRALFWPRR